MYSAEQYGTSLIRLEMLVIGTFMHCISTAHHLSDLIEMLVICTFMHCLIVSIVRMLYNMDQLYFFLLQIRY